MIFRKPTASVDRFVTQAQSYNGYVSRENRENIFGERLGTNGLPWDGMFIDVVAREVGLPLPVMSQTPVALSAFIRNGKLYNKPQRGTSSSSRRRRYRIPACHMWVLLLTARVGKRMG